MKKASSVSALARLVRLGELRHLSAVRKAVDATGELAQHTATCSARAEALDDALAGRRGSLGRGVFEPVIFGAWSAVVVQAGDRHDQAQREQDLAAERAAAGLRAQARAAAQFDLLTGQLRTTSRLVSEAADGLAATESAHWQSVRRVGW